MSASRRALISVSDKRGLTAFARALVDLGLEVIDVSSVTGFPEIMDGRVKTLHPAIHGGLLGRTNVDREVAAEHDIAFIDLLVVNLYPFEKVTANPECTLEEAIENIDIGGPAMLRAGAKNHARLTVVVDTDDYAEVVAALGQGEPPEVFKRRLARKAFAHTARYDATIASFLESRTGRGDSCPDDLFINARKSMDLRYGENAHQTAALYPERPLVAGTIATAAQLQGRELSYNNIADADAALQCIKALDAAACVIVKHMNPCGVAIAGSPTEAYQRAYECDPTSAFGGIIAFNVRLMRETAGAIVTQQFAEVIVAPGVDDNAREILAQKRNIRVLDVGSMKSVGPSREIKSIEGGFLLQDRDLGRYEDIEPRIVTQRKPDDAEIDDMRFAWTVAKFVKSNAIVYVKDRRTLGIGAGQMSRVVSAKVAAWKAEEAGLALEGAVMASDAFFPFRDGIDTAASRGIRAIIQPGGAQKDDEIVAAADEHDVAMVFTGMRHFRH
jgi:phosphoribosylaminoimidazolecarboxamide formyltransferase/IMP cyclohydrolase